MNIWNHCKLTENGKLVPKPKRECPNCYNVGKIVSCWSSNQYLYITRKCMNKKCDLGQDEGEYHEPLPWNGIITIAELEECKKWLEENLENLRNKGNSIRTLERSLKKVNEVLERKKKKREENRMK